MLCSCNLCGWRRPQNGFQYLFAFRRRPAQIFFDKLAGSSKSIVFFRVLSHMADTKTSRQKKSAFRRSGATFFFGFQILINGHVHQASQLHQPAWRTKPASQPGAPSQLGQPSPPGPPSQPDMCTKPAWRTKPAASVPSRLVRNLYTFR